MPSWEKKTGLIAVSATLRGKTVTIRIADDGNGMPEEISFNNSTGFGLALVNGLVKKLKGTIRIERNQGTRIVFEFDK